MKNKKQAPAFRLAENETFRIEVSQENLNKAIDTVNHPTHYNSGKIEVIEFLEDQKLDFHSANAVKYISRAGKKNPEKEIEDLEKAIWYLTRKVATLKAAKTNTAAPRPNEMPIARGK
jgi:ribosomal protein S6